MRRILKKVLTGIFLGAMLVSFGTFKQARAAETFSDINITLVDSIDNVQYPNTSTAFAVQDIVATQSFSVSTTTAVKMYFSWDTKNASRITAWISTDNNGINVIGQKYTINSPGQSVVVMLDAGRYYLCYSTTLTSKSDFALVNYAILGEKIITTETFAQSSKTKPNDLRLSTAANKNINYGFLSETSSIDYYILNITSASDVTCEFNFRAFEGISLSSAVLKIFHYETDALITSQRFNASAAAQNNLKIRLEEGVYYATMSGATTATSLSVLIEPLGSGNSGGGTSTVPAREPATPISVTYVDFIDNYQYPETDKYTTVSGIVGVKSFKLTKPTILKIYMTWDTSAFRSATVWLSRDADGYDIIEAEKTLSKTTSYLFHLLDPGKYYINYKMAGTSNTAKSETGLCVIGQTVSTNEGSNYASSYKNPLTLTPNKTYKGFLSVTAPVDYYKFTLDEKSLVTFTYDFAQLNGSKNSNATINIYNSNNVLIKRQNYSSSGAENNKIQLLLDKGTYYISMTGAETATILKANTVSRTISVKKTASNNKVKLTLSFAFDPAEIKVVKGYVYDDLITDSTTWSKAATLNSKSYTVSSKGYYTFRIKDTYGNYFLKRVNVTAFK